MARKTSKTPSRIWKLGLPFGPADEDWKAVSDQMWYGHQYRNKMVEIDRERLQQFRAAEMTVDLLKSIEERYEDSAEELAEARRLLKEDKSKKRTRNVESSVHGSIKALEKLSRKASIDLKLVKGYLRLVHLLVQTKRKEEKNRQGNPKNLALHNIPVTDVVTTQDFKNVAKEIVDKLLKKKLIKFKREAPTWSELKKLALEVTKQDLVSSNKIKAARKATKAYWGTYLRAEDAVKAAKLSGQDPQFKPWRGDGEIAIQLQGGLTKEELLSGKDTRLQIDPVSEAAWWDTSRGERRRQQQTFVKMRIGSKGRAPIWAKFKLQFHREIPDDAVIKWAWIQRERTGTTERWHLYLNFESKSFSVSFRGTNKRCAIDVGWRKKDNNDLRIGYLIGSDGRDEEISLPAQLRERKRRGESLQSLIDQEFDEIRDKLVDWKKSHRKKLPEWFVEETDSLHLWKSPNRLMGLVWKWGERPGDPKRKIEAHNNRFKGDHHIFPLLEVWRKQYRHLYDWRRNQERKMLAHRKEQYRLIAREIVETYDTVIIENFDLRPMARLDKPEDEVSLEPVQRSQRFEASLSEFKDALKLMATNVGSVVFERESAYTTIQCFSCEEWCDWDAEKYLNHTCEHCGSPWDQDANAGRNLLFGKVKPRTRKKAA